MQKSLPPKSLIPKVLHKPEQDLHNHETTFSFYEVFSSINKVVQVAGKLLDSSHSDSRWPLVENSGLEGAATNYAYLSLQSAKLSDTRLHLWS